MQLKDGYTSSEGLGSTAVRDWYFGSRNEKDKRAYYHWDEKWEFNNQNQEFILEKHNPNSKSPDQYFHARNPHLQFHPLKGNTQRVHWENFEKPKKTC